MNGGNKNGLRLPFDGPLWFAGENLSNTSDIKLN